MKSKIGMVILFYLLMVNINFVMSMHVHSSDSSHFSSLPVELQEYILQLMVLDIIKSNTDICQMVKQMAELLNKVLLVNKPVRAVKNKLIQFFLDHCSEYFEKQYSSLNQLEKNQKLKEALTGNKTEENLLSAMIAVAIGADPNMEIHTNMDIVRPPLSRAVLWPSDMLTTLLILKKANINFQNENGYTPLMQAASKGLDGIVKILLAFRADKTLTNDENQTALDIAKSEDNQEVIKLLS